MYASKQLEKALDNLHPHTSGLFSTECQANHNEKSNLKKSKEKLKHGKLICIEIYSIHISIVNNIANKSNKVNSLMPELPQSRLGPQEVVQCLGYCCHPSYL